MLTVRTIHALDKVVDHSQSRRSGRFDSIGSILEVLDGCVDREHISKVLCALSSEVVVGDTADKCALASVARWR